MAAECGDDDTCKDLKYALVNLELALGTANFLKSGDATQNRTATSIIVE